MMAFGSVVMVSPRPEVGRAAEEDEALLRGLGGRFFCCACAGAKSAPVKLQKHATPMIIEARRADARP